MGYGCSRGGDMKLFDFICILKVRIISFDEVVEMEYNEKVKNNVKIFCMNNWIDLLERGSLEGMKRGRKLGV